MRLVSAALYLGALLAANAVGAQDLGAQDLGALAEGDMRKLVVHEAPEAVPETPVEGGESLADLRGGVAVVNFWATWCAPCREEMPTLAALQAALPEVRVVVVAVGRQDPAEAEAFLAEAGAGDLASWRDPSQALARDMGVLGLPVTVILDAEGREVARLTGDADWASDSALAILRAVAG